MVGLPKCRGEIEGGKEDIEASLPLVLGCQNHIAGIINQLLNMGCRTNGSAGLD